MAQSQQRAKTTEVDRLTQSRTYGQKLQAQVRAGKLTDLEAAALLVEFVAAYHINTETRSGVFGNNSQVADDIDSFLSDLNILLAGRGYNGRYSVFFGDSGFASDLQDRSSQTRHFTGALLAGYDYGFLLGNALALLRELRAISSPAFSTADLRLNELGVRAGDAISGGSLQIEDLGEWMRDHLGP